MYQNHIIMVFIIEDPLCLTLGKYLLISTLEWPNENTFLETYPVHKTEYGDFFMQNLINVLLDI